MLHTLLNVEWVKLGLNSLFSPLDVEMQIHKSSFYSPFSPMPSNSLPQSRVRNGFLE